MFPALSALTVHVVAVAPAAAVLESQTAQDIKSVL